MQHFAYEFPLGIRIGFALVTILFGQLGFQSLISIAQVVEITQRLAEQQMLMPEWSAVLNHVNLKPCRTVHPASEKSPLGKSILVSLHVFIIQRHHWLDAGVRIHERPHPDQDVDDRLGAQPGDGRAADMLILDRNVTQRTGDTVHFRFEHALPARIMLDQNHRFMRLRCQNTSPSAARKPRQHRIDSTLDRPATIGLRPIVYECTHGHEVCQRKNFAGLLCSSTHNARSMHNDDYIGILGRARSRAQSVPDRGRNILSMSASHLQTSVRHARAYAGASSLFFGICLVAWGLMPAVIERTVSGSTPRLETFMAGTVSFLLGLIYIGLYTQIRNSMRWALNTSFLLSLGIVTCWISNILLDFDLNLPAFLVLISGTTMYGCWLGIRAERLEQSQPAFLRSV